jgi:transcriptional regulator with PAS, ATPase and Fis domain
MMLGLQHIPVLGKSFDQVVRIDQTIWRGILRDEHLADQEMTIDVSGRPVFFLCSTAPIRYRGEFLGKILVLTEKQRFYRLMHKLAGNSAKFAFSDIKGNAPELLKQIKLAQVASKTDSRILITGESGTGKELFAQAVHNLSPRNNGPFVAVSCATLPRELIEAELFGYQEGAFTGAKKGGRVGKFELADKGTLFLDEIGLMPLDMQAKLLRVLQANEIIRLGDTEPRPIDVRVVAATNQDLFAQVRDNEFREDLYYRLNVVEIAIPPLRRRVEDLETLAEHVLARVASQLGLGRIEISEKAFRILRSYNWPGNVRELENYLERACILSEGNVILPDHLPLRLRVREGKSTPGPIRTLQEEERGVILSALSESRGNISQAARLLGISRSTIHRRIKAYGVDDSSSVSPHPLGH